MGCGHSKINIYPKKSKSKSSSKKSVAPEKAETEEEDGKENNQDNNENNEENDAKKSNKIKSFGGPLLAHTEISTSQQDFFKMLDDKIQNSPDYNSESEFEKVAEHARLTALLKDWETASAGSRSLPVTPKRKARVCATALEKAMRDPSGSIINSRPPPERNYIPQSVIHQSYGVTQASYRQMNYNNPNYISQSPSHQMSYPSALQYQALSPMYTNQPNYQPQQRQYPSYNQHGSPIQTYANNTPSPKHIPYDQPAMSYSSPGHKLYGPAVISATPPSPVMGVGNAPIYSNGELIQHPQFYSAQYHQQYKEAREQVLVQNQQQHQPPPPVNPVGYRVARNYQSSVTIPIVVQTNQQNDITALHRKQYELT